MLLPRPRLDDEMSLRWERRLTAIVAGVGFGKSALLIRALEANRRERRGHDAWIGCQEEDANSDRLFEVIFTAVRGATPTAPIENVDDAVDRIADAVWSHAPEPVSILLDDVHLLGEGSPGARLLDALVRRLPANAHFVVTSRTTPPVALGRLVSAGEAVVLDEDALAMTPAELSTFAASRGRHDLDLAGTGGWPALAELAAHAGAVRAPELSEYVTGELLADLPKSQVRALAVLSAVGPLPRKLLVSVVGDHDLEMSGLTALPLVHQAGETVEAHSLWEVAAQSIDPEWLTSKVRDAAEALRTEGHTERAFRLALGADHEPLALEILGDLCREAIHRTAEIDLGGCVSALSAAGRTAPVALLAESLSSGNRGWAYDRDRLIQVADALEEIGAHDLELIAITRLGTAAWQAGDASVAAHILPRLERLATSGDQLAVGVAELGGAVLSEIAGDRPAMWQHVRAFEDSAVPEPLRSIGERYHASIDLIYGNPADAIARLLPLEAAAPPGLRVEMTVLLLWANWLEGDTRSAHQRADRLRAHTSAHGVGLFASSNIALLDAWTRRSSTEDLTARASAEELLTSAISAREDGVANSALLLAMAAAAHLVADGDEEGAREALDGALSDPSVVIARLLPAMVRGLALIWVLLPDRRSSLGLEALGLGSRGGLAAARLLEVARSAKPADTSWHDEARPLLDDHTLPTRLPPMWIAELAARFVGTKPDDERIDLALRALEHVGPTAPHALRRLVSRREDGAVAAGAATILARRTPVSEGRFVLRLFGPMALERDGALIEQPDWGRDRVRGLFALISRHGTVSRRTAAETLWPDLAPDAGANNLRVTLSYLQKVLEPERTRHELPYHVRSEGPNLRFAGRSSWTVDVEEFDRHLDAAERDDRHGESANALTGYLDALDWYRGPFLVDVEMGVAQELERERLRSRYVRALIRAGGLLLGAGSADHAQRLAVAAQEADPWSDEALCLQAECFLALGDRASALRTLHRVEALTEELGLPQSAEHQRISRALNAGL